VYQVRHTGVVPAPTIPAWQLVPIHRRRSYWELMEDQRARIRESLEREAADLEAHPEATLAAYAALPDTLGGRLMNADLLATLLPTLEANPTQGYEALEDPDGRAIVHLNTVGKRVRDRSLELAGTAPVLILMGGQASGKTTGAWALGKVFGAVFDAPHTDPDALNFLVRRITPQGAQIHLAYADRSPESALYAMLDRSEREGRYVPLDRMARTHARAPHSFLGLASLLDEGVHLHHIRTRWNRIPEVTQGFDAVTGVAGREKPDEQAVAYRLQNAYLSHLRTIPHDPQAWHPRDVLAGLNRSLDAWRRAEAHHLLERFPQIVDGGSAEGRGSAQGASSPGT
jgi:hypothetical protein